MNRIKYMDGLKGLLWIPVFVGHYGGAFGYTPFWRLHSSIVGEGAFINGNFSVNVFYFISAYVLCNQVYSQLEEGTITPYKIFEKMIKRYYRFAFPLTILYLLIYGISRLGLFYSNQANVFIASDFLGSLFSSTYTLYDVFIDGLVKTLFLGEYKFNSAMWMMNTLFLGWYFSLIMSLCLFFGKKKSERYLIILALILLLIDSFYVMFVVGVLMVKFSGKTNKQGISFLGGGLVIIGLILDDNCRYLTNVVMDLTGATLFENWRFTCRIGAILFCIGVILNNNVKMLLSRKVLLQSAKICFPAFMIHNVVIGTLTSYLYLKLDYVSTYVQFYIFAISFLTVIVLSIIYVRFIEPYINCLITRFMQLI